MSATTNTKIAVYVTTSAYWKERSWLRDREDEDYDVLLSSELIPDPVVPDGENWELVGTAATVHRLFWTWRSWRV